MIIKTEGFVIDAKHSKKNNTLYFNLLTPLGRFYCYTGKINKRPSIFSPEILKYSKIFTKIYFKDYTERGITRFPGDIFELEVIERYGINKTQRRFFRYVRHFLKAFGVLKSNEGIYKVLINFTEAEKILKTNQISINSLKLNSIIKTFELLTLKEEGILGNFQICEHSNKKEVFLFLADRGKFVCTDCFFEIVTKEGSIDGGTKYVNSNTAFEFCNTFSISEKEEHFSPELVIKIASKIEKAKDDVHNLWDQFFIYHFLAYTYNQKGNRFLEERQKYNI